MSFTASATFVEYVLGESSPDELDSTFNSYAAPDIGMHSSCEGCHWPRAIIRWATARRRYRKSGIEWPSHAKLCNSSTSRGIIRALSKSDKYT
jgi:hypothetical protein